MDAPHVPGAVTRLIERASSLTVEEAFDLYSAYGARLLIDGSESQRRALGVAAREAKRHKLHAEYEWARHEAVTAWRRALPSGGGPWMMVGSAIGNAAGALVVEAYLDDKTYRRLIGPWQQAIGSLVPVGPGLGAPLPALAFTPGRREP